ncbi:MAG: hypothetical protein ACRCYU_15980, partial [Nocardioides sp.]
MRWRPARPGLTVVAGPQVFVDETKARDYVMVATAISPGTVSAARRQLRGLLLPGQERVHFNHERSARRRQILDVMGGLEVRAGVYVMRTRDHRAGRQACLSRILDWVLTEGASHL